MKEVYTCKSWLGSLLKIVLLVGMDVSECEGVSSKMCRREIDGGRVSSLRWVF